MGEKWKLKLHLTIIDSLLILQLRLIATKKKRMETCRLLLGLILWPEPQMIISMKSIFHTIFDTTILIMHQAPRTLPKRLSSKFFFVICNIPFRTIWLLNCQLRWLISLLLILQLIWYRKLCHHWLRSNWLLFLGKPWEK